MFKRIALLLLTFTLLFLTACADTLAPTDPTQTTVPELEEDAIAVHFAAGRWMTGSTVYNPRVSSVTTQLFRENTLPVGSRIELGSDYTCQIVAWKDYEAREGAEKLDDLITVPEDFWTKYDACGINISVASGSSKTLNDAMNEVKIMAPAGKSQRFQYDWNDDGVLKILTVGNSFSDDLMMLVYDIARDAGVEKMELGNLVYPSCRVWQHHDFWINNKAVYEYRNNSSSSWITQNGSTFEKAFETTDWDYICFQESAQEVQSTASLYEHLPDLIKMAKERCPNAKIIWHMPWANPHANYSQSIDAMYQDLCVAARVYIEPLADIQLVIPCGTAIQNMRTTYAGTQDLLLRDGWHLSTDVGRYITGLTLVRQLTGLSIDNVTWAPNDRAESVRELCIESANNAVLYPYSVTQSVYTNDPQG